MFGRNKNEINVASLYKRIADIEGRMLEVYGRIDNHEERLNQMDDVAQKINDEIDRVSGMEKIDLNEKDEKKVHEMRKDEQGSREDKETRTVQTVQEELHTDEHD